MGQRDTQLGRESGEIDSPDPGSQDARTPATSESQSLRSRVRERAGSLFSTRAWVINAVLAVVGLILVGGLLPLGMVGNLLGLFAAAFSYGTFSGERRYLEAASAGATVGAGWSLIANPVLAVLGAGMPIVGVGLVGGALSSLVGHYFGRDLRAGLTKEI